MKTSPCTVRLSLAFPVAIVCSVVLVAFSTNHRRQVAAAPPSTQPSKKATVRYTSDGQLIQPTGYRRWVYVGTPLTPNDMNNGMAAFPEFHSVYMNPTAFNPGALT